jgi:eukaryotic-like serine/threonine-protein kinase
MIGVRLGPWIVEGELGRGGMGTVYRARADPISPDRPAVAAIKVLAAELALDPGFRQRFQREIDILRELEHPNVVRFFGSGEENGRYYFAMELVEGAGFDVLLEQHDRIPWPEVLDLALQVTLALRHAHDRGVIHRDLKPSNLMRVASTNEDYPFGIVKLTDFGIASLFSSPHLTVPGGVVGTAEYLSPEQAVGKPVTKRSDLYSLGVVLYTLLTGRTPFRGDVPTLLHQHRFGQFDRPGRLVTDLPPDLDEVICELMEKDPSRRPGDASSLYRRLESIRRKMERVAANVEAASALPTLGVSPEGSATLMSRLMRAELERQNRGGPIQQFLNKPLVIITLLMFSMGLIVWTFWPTNAESLFRKGSVLMASDDPEDWERGWNDFLEPMNQRFPDHSHQSEIQEFRAKYEAYRDERAAARTAKLAGPMSEANWFFQEGLRRRQVGDEEGARRVWRLMVESFGAVRSERPWVRRAQAELDRLPGEKVVERHLEPVKEALRKIDELRAAGKGEEADAMQQALRDLYKGDKGGSEILKGK